MDALDQYVAATDTVITRGLMEAATPDLYRQNAFRVLQLPVHTTMHDVTRREKTLAMAQKLGLEAGNGAGELLPLSPPPDVEAIREAKRRLADPPRRMVDELFWFWTDPGTGDDDRGLQSLRQGRVAEALAAWLQAEEQDGSVVAAHNATVLYHLFALDAEHAATDGMPASELRGAVEVCWQRAFRRWQRLLADPCFWDHIAGRMRSLADPRLGSEALADLRRELPRALLAINARLILRCVEGTLALDDQRAAAEFRTRAMLHHELVDRSAFDPAAKESTLRRIAAPTRERIKLVCARIRDRAAADPERSADCVGSLLADTGAAQRTLTLLLPVGNPTREAALDEIAELGRNLTVRYYGHTEDWETCQGLLERLAPLASSDATRTQIDEDLEAVRLIGTNSTCFYCGAGKSEAGDAAKFPMHLVTEVRRVFNGRQINYQQADVSVPRCTSCRYLHETVKTRAILICIVAVAVVSISVGKLVWWLISSLDTAVRIFGTLMACLALSTVVSIILYKKVIRWHGYEPDQIPNVDAGEKHANIQAMKAQGWCLGKEPQT
jgi:DNA-binding transcriptional ArsR family regulator